MTSGSHVQDHASTEQAAQSGGILERIWLFPVKSLDGVRVASAQITAAGALLHDREFALFDADERYVNAKRHARIHLIRARFQSDAPLRVELSAPDRPVLRADLADSADVARAATWFSDWFDFPVTIRRAADSGFPDDTKRPGPTVVSRASLETASEWLSPLTADELAERFRANLEVAGVPAFWEDRLLAPEGVPFRVGAIEMTGLNPCARCVVPTRDPRTAELHDKFAQTFTARRKASLPEWADANLFSHYYRISTNTSIDARHAGATIREGDSVSLAS
ncbi:MAG: MOSC N-terminal beta barrel domain-containing protein [bacterium]|nr:MOSC N-terminal beta barrel domain-containing protein [bacterium]